MMGGFIILDRRIIIFDRKQKKETRNESPFVVDRGIEPLCPDWESCILTIRWIDQHLKERFRREIPPVAEGGGFEPPVREPVRQFSKLLVSATHPSFLKDPGVRNRGVISLIAGAKVQLFFEPCKFFDDFFYFSLIFLFHGDCLLAVERNTGLEPATLGLGSQCSTNWANSASALFFEKEKESECCVLTPRKWADSRTRTGDPRITNALLYQLSHIGSLSKISLLESGCKGNTFFCFCKIFWH